jgi:2-haloacid dehalogenase
MPPPHPNPQPLSKTLKALTFDVFGTTVSWREHITTALTAHTTAKLTSPSSIPEATITRLQTLTQQDWALFAEQWRHSYNEFTHSFVPGPQTPWKDVDTHHRDSLIALLDEWGLGGGVLYTASELDELSRAWHFLPPWPDSREGLRRLNAGRFATATLSNGNRALLQDLDAHGELGFGKLISAEDFGMYKPRPEVYRGACAVLGCEPREVAMVAAHLGDLAAAREVGMRTVYVERPGEEEWGVEEERFVRAREWVDLWVGEGEGGFEEVARMLGV